MGRALAIAEALWGQIYLVTLVAAIVGGPSGRRPGGMMRAASGNTDHDGPPHGRMRIALAQVNTTVGDIDGQRRHLASGPSAHGAARSSWSFPSRRSTAIRPRIWCCGALPGGRPRRASSALAGGVEGIVALVGFAERDAGTYNSLAVLADGGVRGVYRKMLLPNYGVFDERRYFEPGDRPSLLELNGVRLGLTVCEDVWFPGPPASVEALAGASLIVNASASPYHRGKGAYREGMLAERASETGAAFAMCNLVGGQDELVFDGHSLVVSADGEVLARGGAVRAGARRLRSRARGRRGLFRAPTPASTSLPGRPAAPAPGERGGARAPGRARLEPPAGGAAWTRWPRSTRR